MAIFPGSAIPSAVSAYDIDNSLRFNAADSSKLSRTPSIAGDRKTWTMSCWVKTTGNNNGFVLMDAGANPNYLAVYMYQGTIRLYDPSGAGGTNEIYIAGTRLLRDPSAWYHIVVQLDTTESTNTDRVKIYVNNERETVFTQTDWPDADYESFINSAVEHTINDTGGTYSDCYMAEYYFIDGTALTPSSFGELDSTTNQWIPIDASGLTFGTNGFYQKYSVTELANSFTDSSDHSIHTITANGDAHTDTTIKKFGTASYQGDGTGDFLTVPDSLDWDWGTEDFTVDFWIYLTNYDSYSGEYVFGMYTAGYGGFQLSGGDSSGPDTAYYYTGSGVSYTLSFSAGDIVEDQWHHLALQRTGSTLQLFIDGVKEAEATSATHDFSGGGTFYVGAINTNVSHTPLEGYLDEFRVSKGIARYTTTFTPETSAYTADKYTALLLHMDGSDSGTTFTDSSWTSSSSYVPRHTITANGDVANTRAVRKIGDSSIVFDGTGDYLSVAASSDWDITASNSESFTLESWVKLDLHDDQETFLSASTSGSSLWRFRNRHGYGLSFQLYEGGVLKIDVLGGEIADTDWHHVALVKVGNTSDSTYTIYKDGVSVATATDSDTFTQNVTLEIGAAGGGDVLDGYMDEIRVSNLARYTENFTTFGQGGGTIASPTPFTADANTKLLIHSNWDGGLGADSSGNYNTFTPTNLDATDQMPDSPTNNFCTMNPLTKRVSTLSEGNLKHTTSHSSAVATFGVTTGKWYWEQTWSGGKNEATIGFALDGADIFDTSKTTGSSVQGTNYVTLYVYDGKIYNEGSAGSALDTFAGDDILGWAVDADAGDVYLYRNGTALNSGSAVVSGKTGRTWFPMGQFTTGDVTQINYNFGADSSFAAKFTSGSAAAEDSNGKGDFYYTPKSSYLSLCTDNLSAPEIALPGDNFNTVLWTGDGAASRSITGTGFQADMMWSKIRTSAHQHNLVDRVRGVDERLLMPNLNNAEDFGTPTHGWFDSLDSDGFTITGAGGDWNVNTDTYLYVGWNWKAGGAPTADNDNTTGAMDANSVALNGSLQAAYTPEGSPSIYPTKMSINTTSGFSTVKYAGNNTSGATVPHGLSETPELIIIKNTEAVVDWIVYSEPVGPTKGLQLNGTGDAYDYLAYFNDTSPTPSVFSLGNYSGVNANTEDMIAYCFHSVEGYSKVGGYTANANADGPFFYCGFRPAWVLVKNITSGSSHWWIMDDKRSAYNIDARVLFPDDSAAEISGQSQCDFVSNGIKFRSVINPESNYSTNQYLVYAVAESPFKTSNAR